MSKSRTSKISTLGSQITTVVSVALVLFILGVLAVIFLAAGRVSTTIMGEISAIVKLDLGATEAQVQQVGAYLIEAPYTAELEYTSADEVLQQEMEYNAEVLELIGENPYSAEYEVKLKAAYVEPDSIAALSAAVMLLPGVDEVVTQIDMVKSVVSATRRISVVLGCVAGVLLLISIVLIFNTVSIGVYGRRFVIRTMQLVGATGGFIRRPFIVAGLWSGFLAALLASGLLIAAQAYVGQLNVELYLDLPPLTMAAICGALCVLGLAICGIAAMCATNRYLRASYDALYS
ncbi:MAG: permease-like cell division protein FtsX [Bacteroidales bacterium]|nr:permease-like cell division protein FtsX [Bacteroidales bacterium]